MFDYLIQNFNWSSFLLALGVLVLISSLFNLVKAYIFKIRANRQVKLADDKLSGLMKQMKEKEKEMNDLLSQEGGNK